MLGKAAPRWQRRKASQLKLRNLAFAGFLRFWEPVMQDGKQQPYFFNPGMTPEQLEDWLGQQKLHLTYYNQLVNEKAALEERLNEISAEIERMSAGGFKGKLSFSGIQSASEKSSTE